MIEKLATLHDKENIKLGASPIMLTLMTNNLANHVTQRFNFFNHHQNEVPPVTTCPALLTTAVNRRPVAAAKKIGATLAPWAPPILRPPSSHLSIADVKAHRTHLLLTPPD